MKVDDSTHYLNFVRASHELNAANRQQERTKSQLYANSARSTKISSIVARVLAIAVRMIG